MLPRAPRRGCNNANVSMELDCEVFLSDGLRNALRDARRLPLVHLVHRHGRICGSALDTAPKFHALSAAVEDEIFVVKRKGIRSWQ